MCGVWELTFLSTPGPDSAQENSAVGKAQAPLPPVLCSQAEPAPEHLGTLIPQYDIHLQARLEHPLTGLMSQALSCLA